MTAFNDRGIAYGAKGDHDRAIKDFDQVVKLDAKNAVALNNRGIAYRNQGKYDRAIADFDAAITLKPDYAVAMYNRGTAYYDKLDYDRAIASFDAVIKLDPSNVRGAARPRRGAIRQAQLRARHRRLRPARQGQRQPGGRAKPRTARPTACSAMTAPAPAQPRQLKLNPSYAQAFNDRGLEFSSKGEFDKAIADYNQSIKINPNVRACPITIAATPSTASAISTRRWPTSTPPSSSIRRARSPITIAA